MKNNIKNTSRFKKSKIEHWHIISILLVIYDLVAVNGAYFIALWARFDFNISHIPSIYINTFLNFLPIYSVFCILVFYICKLYRSLWRFASFSEFFRVCAVTIITSLFQIAMTMLFFDTMPRSYYLFGMCIQFLLILGIRFAYRFVLLMKKRNMDAAIMGRADRVMLIGAGEAGQLILKEIQASKDLNDRVCCIIDDNPNKWNRYINGVKIVGGRDDILLNVEKYKIEKIYIAIPSLSGQDKRDILNICKETGCVLKNLPGIYKIVNDYDVSIKAMKDVAVEDLLGREVISVDTNDILRHLADKVILVTGGGGSIGSELCRQIAGHAPKQLIIFDMYENNAYDIEQELKEKYPNLNMKVLIGSVRDSRKVNHLFETYKPDIVYHAAAHKHVPLMEYSPCEAIKNNAMGTYKTAYAAMMNGCQRFVLISTDKAVNPTNIMGASKRLCEMIIQSFAKKIGQNSVADIPAIKAHIDYKETDADFIKKVNEVKTEFVAVRFGNVLGSNGSVIPLFKKQIAKGGPVKVTHPDIIRYFMTIPEAVSLVLQAGSYAKGGEIFVLDMGSPMKIDTLARNLIKLSGYTPDVDIKIEYTGLRPGEKLFEEKLMAEEGLKSTPNKLIHIGKPIEFDVDEFYSKLEILMEKSFSNDEESVRKLVQEIVKTYKPA